MGLSAYDKVLNAIIAKGNADNITKGDDPGEIKFAYKDNYQCDNYVEDILSSAGFKSKDYSIDDPNGKNVDNHIADLLASGNTYQTDASKLTDGVYVVFMSDDDEKERSHSGLLFVDENGGSFYV